METTTLAAISKHPLRCRSKFAIPAKGIADKLLTVNKSDTSVKPDDAAVSFYGLNQLIAILENKFTTNEVLPDWASEIVKRYSTELADQHRRMLWYTFLVVSREWRHCKNISVMKSQRPDLLVSPLVGIHSSIHDSTSTSHLDAWLEKIPEVDLSHYCEAITYCFNNGSWGGGYGGKPWGNIGNTLYKYVSGDISAEMFIDTAYTLAHNNGPMFNKGMLYGMYSSEFIKILDVQRSGQVCEGILEGYFGHGFNKDLIKNVVTAFPDSIGSYVDWYQVEKLGAVHTYPKEKKHQDTKYGKKTVLSVIDGKAVKYTKSFQWFTGKSEQIFERMAS